MLPQILTPICDLSHCRGTGRAPRGQGSRYGLGSAKAQLGWGPTVSCGHALTSQAEELRTQLRLLEDAREGLRRELLEAQRRVREGQDGREAQRQEAGELRRSLSEGAKELEALRRSNEELRAAVKKAESERVRWGDAGAPAPSPSPRSILRPESCPWNLISPPRSWGNRTAGESLPSNHSPALGLL